MKKFRLKPSGDSCTRKFSMSWFLMGLVMTFCMSACSDDDDKTVAPIFPEKQNISCNAGETKEFSFEANTNWSLTSSAIWCKFVNEGTEEFSLSGEAGKQTITIKVTDDAQKNELSIAKLELIMGGQKVIIGEVSRSAKGYDLKIYDAQGNEIQEIEVGYSDFSSFTVKANFRFAATNRPEWVEVSGGSIVGGINKEVMAQVRFKENGIAEKYPVEASQANVMTFADEEGKAVYSFPVTYKGMDPEKIEFTLPEGNTWAEWVVSLDGKTFKRSASGGSTSETTITTYKNSLPFTVKTLNDDYEIVCLEKWGDQFFLVGEEWLIYTKKENGAGKLEILPSTDEERTGYVLAFPRALYKSFGTNILGAIVDFELGEIKYKYQQANQLITFVQKQEKSAEAAEFKITYYDKDNNWALTEIEATKVIGGVADDYAPAPVYTSEQLISNGYDIDPLLGADYTYMAFMGDEDVTNKYGYFEPSNGKVTAFFDETISEEIHVIFKQGWETKKVLIITPKYN